MKTHSLHLRTLARIIMLSGFLTSILSSCQPEPQKILYINSYHEGYPSSDDIHEGILSVLEESDVQMHTFYLDTKHHLAAEHIQQKVNEALDVMAKFKPDLVIASDDNAVLHVVKPHLDRSTMPVIFCGVNWSADAYKLGNNVTGMLEVYPLGECLQTAMDQVPEARKLAVLSENTQSEKNNTALLDTLYRRLGLEPHYHMVDDFSQWKLGFSALSDSMDLIYMPTNGAIRDWNREEAIAHIREHIRIPVLTCDDFMMDYCVFGMTKVAQQQGEWAAETALQILKDGTRPQDIPYTQCSRWHSYLNQDLASRIAFKLNKKPEGAFTMMNPATQ